MLLLIIYILSIEYVQNSKVILLNKSYKYRSIKDRLPFTNTLYTAVGIIAIIGYKL